MTPRLFLARSGARLRGWFTLRGLRRAALGTAIAIPLAAATYVAVLVPFTPAVDDVMKSRDERPSTVLAADGTVLTSFRRVNREWVGLDKIPRHVVDALIATEDHRFYEHDGIDWRRTVASAWLTLRGERQGGSTITQQLARNFFVEEIGSARTVTRKVREMITAARIEQRYSKREILESYLNTVGFLYNAIGIEMAARTYFDKPASKLSVLEGATLVGMLKGTSVYNPVLNPERARDRRNVVLAQMVRHGKLSQKTYEGLRGRPLGLDFERQDLENNRAPHFTEAVRRWAIGWAEMLSLNIYADGLTIHTTLDPKLQQMATAAVTRQLDALQAVADVEWGRPSERLLSTQAASYRQARAKTEPFAHFWKTRADLLDAFVRESPEFAAMTSSGASPEQALARLRADAGFLKALRERKTRLEAGLVAIDPRTGHVRAWVGSRDHAIDRFDHVQQARRQPGSTFKPFVYGAALESGVDQWHEYPDRPVTVRLPNGDVWRPRDTRASTGGNVSLEDGLVYSRNSITVQVLGQVGAKRVVDFARRLGVRDSALDAVPSLALGTSPVSLLEMTSAYGTIAALGAYRPPLLVTRVVARDGAVLLDQTGAAAPPAEQVLDGEVATQLIDMMRGVVERGTGRGIRDAFGIGADVAGKTGTTQNNTDGWFVLMHPQLVAGAWVGFNDARVTLRSNHWGQGAHTALPVVGDFTRAAIAQRAIDGAEAFPTRGGNLAVALRRFGDRLRSWLGLDSGPRP